MLSECVCVLQMRVWGRCKSRAEVTRERSEAREYTDAIFILHDLWYRTVIQAFGTQHSLYPRATLTRSMPWSDTLTIFITGLIVAIYVHNLERLREQVRPTNP